MLLLGFLLILFGVTNFTSCGRIDAGVNKEISSTTEVSEKPHIDLILDRMPSVSEDHIKVLDVKNGSVYDAKTKGKPELLRTLNEKVHMMNTTDFDEKEMTTELHPESTSHSHVYERTAHTKTTVHKTKKEKPKVTTTEMPSMIHHSRSKRSGAFTKEEMESFSEMGKVFSESFKKFNDDAMKAQKDFNSFMEKLDKLSAKHDDYRY